MHSLYRSETRGPEDDSIESKHVALISQYMFNITTFVFDGCIKLADLSNTEVWKEFDLLEPEFYI